MTFCLTRSPSLGFASPSGRLSGSAPFLMAPECRSSSSLHSIDIAFTLAFHSTPKLFRVLSRLQGSALGCSPDFPVLLSVYIVDLRIERGCLWGVLEDFEILKKLLRHCFFLLCASDCQCSSHAKLHLAIYLSLCKTISPHALVMQAPLRTRLAPEKNCLRLYTFCFR